MTLNFEEILAKVLQPLMQRRDYGGNQLFKPPIEERLKEVQKEIEKESSVTKRRRNGNWHTKSNNVSENLSVKRKFNTHEINF
jgi:hypothetical protein